MRAINGPKTAHYGQLLSRCGEEHQVTWARYGPAWPSGTSCRHSGGGQCAELSRRFEDGLVVQMIGHHASLTLTEMRQQCPVMGSQATLRADFSGTTANKTPQKDPMTRSQRRFFSDFLSRENKSRGRVVPRHVTDFTNSHRDFRTQTGQKRSCATHLSWLHSRATALCCSCSKWAPFKPAGLAPRVG